MADETKLPLDKLKTILSCIDNTTLEGCDTHEKIKQLCERSISMQDSSRGIPHVAAVCVYPVFVAEAKRYLQGSGIKVASVAGAFPAGQSPISIKVQEVQYAVAEGADEIDMVISRGSLLEGDYKKVQEEVEAIRNVCQRQHLKVILETGELQTLDNIAKASQLAIEGGADFIKTSTGKIGVGATLEAAEIMLKIIKQHHEKTGKIVGFKAAGGISTPEQALEYYDLVEKIMGVDFVKNQYFRIGASRLTNRLFEFLLK